MKSKTVSGALTHLFDFGQRMPVGETLAEAGITIEAQYGEEPAPTLTWALTKYDRQNVTFNFIGGTPGIVYRVWCSVKTTANNIYNQGILISVIGD
jgi:hypothetical protein